MDELSSHPTVKPVAMLADAIKDVTRHRDIVLDPFLGSGSTLIAAEKTGRLARGIEYERKYCDLTIRRWQAYTGRQARLIATGQSYEDVAEERLGVLPEPTPPLPKAKRRAR
jgi:DNA modification methylase